MKKYNHEGYHDPTTYEALRKVESSSKEQQKAVNFLTFDGFRPLVYISSPYAGDIKLNIANARRYSRFALSQKAIPLAPHLLYPQFMDNTNPIERDFARYKVNYVLIGKCDELWVFGNAISSGMEYEISVAKKRNMRIRYFTDDLKEVRL